jgi:exodeoxyribonuclease X
MLIRVIDFETTGEPPDAAVCEVGWCDVPEGDVDGYHAFLCDPGRPIPPEARAIRHISDRDVADAPPAAAIFRMLMDGAAVFCAHNAAFEREFFGGGEHPWICTMKVARRLWPECPRHTNQCLRYWLGLELEYTLSMPSHRAGPDAYVTAQILGEALKLATIDQMIAWTKQPSLLPSVTFGKHRGQQWKDLPTDYLVWLIQKSDTDADTKYTAKHHLDARKPERDRSRF